MKKAIEWAKDFWGSLPQKVQAGVVVFASAAATFAGTAFSNPGSCWTLICIKHALGASVGAGLVALRAFYMRPGPGRNGGPSYEGS
jgi:hypothetical protein